MIFFIFIVIFRWSLKFLSIYKMKKNHLDSIEELSKYIYLDNSQHWSIIRIFELKRYSENFAGGEMAPDMVKSQAKNVIHIWFNFFFKTTRFVSADCEHPQVAL